MRQVPMRTVKQVQRAKDSPWEEFLRAHFKRENPSETGNKKHQCFPIIVAARPMLHKELSIPTKICFQAGVQVQML